MPPLWSRVDLGAVVVKGHSAFPKAPALLEPYHQIVKCHIQDTRWRVLPLRRHAAGIFYSPSRRGQDRYDFTEGDSINNGNVFFKKQFYFSEFFPINVYSALFEIVFSQKLFQCHEIFVLTLFKMVEYESRSLSSWLTWEPFSRTS